MAIRNDMIGKSGSVGNIIDTTTDERRVSVLIVDDDPLIQKIHRIMLKQFKLDVDVVENGKHAVDLHRSGASFNLILMDMEMPIMNGIEATKELRGMGVDNMIVGVTSRALESAETQAFIQAGLDNCYLKPLTLEKINSLLQLIHIRN